MVLIADMALYIIEMNQNMCARVFSQAYQLSMHGILQKYINLVLNVVYTLRQK